MLFCFIVMDFHIKDKNLAKDGKLKIEWAARLMPVLRLIKQRFSKERPLEGINIGACLHVTSETGNLMITLKAGGAAIALCASNPLSTKDPVAASLVVDYKIPVFAIRGEDNKTYYQHLNSVLDTSPNITMDDGADLVGELHKSRQAQVGDIIGGSEETTTGILRLRAMVKEDALKFPMVAVNDSETKRFFDNRYGTGQSTIDGILRATNILLAGKNFVIAGYGFCGRGIAKRAEGMGANVIVTEVVPVKALEAVMDGFQVMPILKAAKIGDIFVTATGNKNVVDIPHFEVMKEGAILANSGHFNVELNIEGLREKAKKIRKISPLIEEVTLKNGIRIYILGEGRLINLAAADGHPAEVMDMSFANQALAAEYLVQRKGKLENKVYRVPEELDHEIAALKLNSIGVMIDELTSAQKEYLESWQEGT